MGHRQQRQRGAASTEKDKNIDISWVTMRPYRKKQEKQKEPIVIGYYPFRAKAQLARLICEYLHIEYVDKLFTPDEWSRYKETEAKDWVVKDLPFVLDGDFVVTGPAAIGLYILEREGRSDLLGRNLADRIKIDSIKSKHDLKTAILGLICVFRPNSGQEDQPKLKQMWTSRIEPILRDYENDCCEEGWYLGYITVMDFFVYELLNLISTIFPHEVTKFSKLQALRARVANIPEIRDYEKSERAVREFSPVDYFSRYKEEMRAKGNGEIHKMDVE